MTMEEFAATLRRRFPPFEQIPAILQGTPAFLEKLPFAIYACDR
jgi:hypothetical protein